MAMSISPPQGSKILVITDSPDEVIVIPQKGGVVRYLWAIFVLVWLTFWTLGFGGGLARGGSAPVFVFVAFAFGEATGIYMLYRTLRPSVPETLKLRADGISYDSGIPAFRTMPVYMNDPDYWRILFPRRTRLELSRPEVRSVRLRETDSGNRLTYDLGSSRIDIARGASEIEREWLAKVLLERYK